jgi:hypothetical protein
MFMTCSLIMFANLESTLLKFGERASLRATLKSDFALGWGGRQFMLNLLRPPI